MTFSVTVPNASQSPGLFPAQNNINFLRLKDIFNNDHNFTDSSTPSQGIHKQVTLINRTAPGSLPVGNGILYSAVDTFGLSQLRWYNGSSDSQVSNTGSVLIGSGNVAITTSSTPMFTVPANSFGYIYMWINGSLGTCSSIFWQSSSDRVLCQQVPTYLGATSSNTIIPIITDNSVINVTLNLLPKSSSATYNGNYQYRVFQVA